MHVYNCTSVMCSQLANRQALSCAVMADAGPLAAGRTSALSGCWPCAREWTRPPLRRMLAVAREFAEEWSELRGLHQQKLAGQLLRCGRAGSFHSSPSAPSRLCVRSCWHRLLIRRQVGCSH